MADDARARRGQEGSRWYNERPTGEDISQWFRENVHIEEGLDPADYVTGITLIPGEEKSKEVVGYRDNGSPVIEERINLAYTPYPRVDTRVKYFHDLMALKADEWVGYIEPIEVPTPKGTHLPPGFFTFRVQEDNGVTTFICCSMKVTVYKRGTVKEEHRQINNGRGDITTVTRRTGEVIIDGPPATKMIGVRKRYADSFSLMKAETGAVGRALGLAGMLVVPGAGVATAEDMAEVPDIEARPPEPVAEGAAQPQAGPQETGPTDDELRQEAASIIEEMRLHFPEALEDFRAWAKERNMGKLSEVTQPALKGVVRQLERKLDEARESNPPLQSDPDSSGDAEGS